MLLDIAGYCWSTDIDPRNVTQVLEEDGATTTSAFLKPFEPQPHIATPLRSFVGLAWALPHKWLPKRVRDVPV